MDDLDYVVSGDSHIIEPFDLWTRTLVDKHGERLPQVVDNCNGVPGVYFFGGYEYFKLGDVEPKDTVDSTGATKEMSDEMVDKVNRSNTDPEGGLGESLSMWRLERPVDDYMQTQVWHGFTDDQFFDLAYEVAGPTRIMWGSDFPHPRNTFPNSHEIINRVLTNVSAEVKADVAGLNCARLFKLDVPAGMGAAAE